MTIPAGARLGPYEILSPLGAGGMGEVYRARDARLARDVAIKVLPEDLASDPERLRRFEREARAASALSHPNIVTIYEVAQIDSRSLIVMELVEGRTLRQAVAGAALPFRKILSIAPQIADGLARAHASGIVHRDLKPENVMVTPDGVVKILDFGLAKLTRPEDEQGQTASAMTVSAATRPGIAMGTVSYMSPEQAAGHPVDFRSDQFSLGSVLYEMATGKPAFKRETAPQTLAAIIEAEPEPIGEIAPRTPAPLRWVIARCLSKEPRGRYASTEDLARELSDLRDHVSDLSAGSGVEIEPPHRRTRWGALGLTAAFLLAAAAAFLLGRRLESRGISNPRFRQLTFRGAGIGTARFAPDGRTIVFSAQTEGRPPELFSMRLEGPEARSLGLPPAQVLSISSSDQMAILLAPPFALGPRVGHIAFEQATTRDPFLLAGTLAVAPLGGGAPREILTDVSFADWDAEGKDLAVVHRAGNRYRVEYPIGTTIFDREQAILNHLRFSTRNLLALKDWGVVFLKQPGIAVGDKVSNGADIEIAWHQPGGEFWTALGPGGGLEGETEIRGITPGHRIRTVAHLPGEFVLYDIAPDGRALLGRLTESNEILGTFPGEPGERNLTFAHVAGATALSDSGDELVVSGTNSGNLDYLQKIDGSEPKRLRDDCPVNSFSPDGSLFLCFDGISQFSFAPVGPGPVHKLERGDATSHAVDPAGFFPDGKRIYFAARDKSGKDWLWMQALEDGSKPRPMTPAGVRRPVVLGDGRFVCAQAADLAWYLYPVDEKSEPRKVVGILPGEEPLRSSPEGLLYLRGADELRPGERLMTTRIFRLDPITGRRELWKEIPPRDPRTGGAISSILLSADGKTCVWTHIRYSTELVLAEGLK